MVMTEAGPLFELVVSFLDDMELEYEQFGDAVARVPFESDVGAYNVFVHAREAQRQVVLYATWTGAVPEDRRAPVMELLTRINLELAVSWFELDLDDGAVSARAGLALDGVDATDVMVENIFYAAEQTLQRFLPAITAVALEGLDPRDIPPSTAGD